MPVLMYQNYQTVTRPRFTMDDSGLQTPPPGPFAQTFANQLPEIYIYAGSSPFDPPPAPRFDCFPGDFPSSPKFCGPAPIDTSLQVSQKLDLDSAMNSPVLPEARTLAVARSLNPPPAPTSGEFQEEVYNSPAHNDRAIIGTSIDSPNKTLSNMRNTAKIIPKALVRASMTKDSLKRLPRPSPIPINKNVRFADLRSPAHSQLRSPGLHSHFSQVPSPAVISPTTPLAMSCTFPTIVGVSPSIPQEDFLTNSEEDLVLIHHEIKEEAVRAAARGRFPGRYSSKEQPRARSISPLRSTSLLISNEPLASLPATVYDPTAIYDAQTDTRTMAYPVPTSFETKSYTVRDITDNDRSRILKSYFNRASSEP